MPTKSERLVQVHTLKHISPRPQTPLRRSNGDKDEQWHDEHQYSAELEKLRFLAMLQILPLQIVSESHLTRVYVHVSEVFHLQDTTLFLVPPRIGADRTVDLAAEAVTSVLSDRMGDSEGMACTRKYVNAIASLRQSMETASWIYSEAILVAVFLLIFRQNLIRLLRPNAGGAESREAELHARGMVDLLRAQASHFSGSNLYSEILRALRYQAWRESFWRPVLRGESSPLDRPELEMDPPSYYNLPKELAILRKKAHYLFSRLPAVIARLRKLRASQQDSDRTADLQREANALLGFRFDEGEDSLLHRVKIVQSPPGFADIRCSFVYPSVSEFKTALLYWGSQLVANRIHLRLLRMGISTDSGTEDAVRLRMEGIAANIFMTWNFGQKFVLHGFKVLFPSLAMLWGLLNDFADFRGKPSEQVKCSILKVMESEDPVAATREDLDAASDTLVGGPIGGLEIPAFDSFFGI